MKFSLNWLSDFVETKDFFSEPEKLSNTLTSKGLEVEEVQDFQSQFKHIIVGEIKEVKKHPQADRLTLCKVFTGKEELPIVCGAKNHKVGDKVALALPGACLPGDFLIKVSRIRGEESAGMLASESELGLAEESDGILILPSETKTGEAIASCLGLNDILFEVSVTPNRADCLSHFGLAREISCLFNRPLLQQNIKVFNSKKGLPVKSLPVQVKEQSACPRYAGKLIHNVEIKESPRWLKKRLEAIGLKPINNVVDVTNYVLMELGQPLHAFDQDKIKSICVDKSVKGEKFKALNGNLLELTGKELTIRDDKTVLALAGVIGGEDSSITLRTKNIFLESAYFRPEWVRRSARRFGLQTDSSYRFSRGTDPEMVKRALERACMLIQELAGGESSEDIFDEDHRSDATHSIKIQKEDLETRLGYEVKSLQFKDCMTRLQCDIQIIKEKSFEVTPPSFRVDLNIKEDLIEEFARLKGYEEVPSVLRRAPQLHFVESEFFNFQHIESILKNQGWYQTIHYSFTDGDVHKEFLKNKKGLEDIGLGCSESFSLVNPISSRLSFMKTLLIPDLFQTTLNNFRKGNKAGQIFEISPVFKKENKQYTQIFHLGLAHWGEKIDFWNENKKIPNLFYIKSSIETLLKKMQIKGFVWKRYSSSLSFLHPKQMLALEVQGKRIGFIGTIHPIFQIKYKIPCPVALGEIHLETLNTCKKSFLKVNTLSDQIDIERDFSFTIPLDVPVGSVKEAMKKAAGSVCKKVIVFDIYEKKEERSVSFRMYLTPPSKNSFTDKNLQELQLKVMNEVKRRFL